MSDALTDIARDGRRAEAAGKMLDCIIAHLEHPTQRTLKKALQAAEETDDIRGGYWSGKTKHAKGFEEKLKKLTAREEEPWAKFLAGLEMDNEKFRRLKSLSPLAGYTLFLVDYGHGFVNIEGEGRANYTNLSTNFHSLIEKKSWRTYDCDKYLAAIPASDLEEPKVFWIRCGILGINGPRKT